MAEMNHTECWRPTELVRGMHSGERYVYDTNGDKEVDIIYLPGGRRVRIIERTGIYILGDDGSWYVTPEDIRRG